MNDLRPQSDSRNGREHTLVSTRETKPLSVQWLALMATLLVTGLYGTWGVLQGTIRPGMLIVAIVPLVVVVAFAALVRARLNDAAATTYSVSDCHLVKRSPRGAIARLALSDVVTVGLRDVPGSSGGVEIRSLQPVESIGFLARVTRSGDNTPLIDLLDDLYSTEAGSAFDDVARALVETRREVRTWLATAPEPTHAAVPRAFNELSRGPVGGLEAPQRGEARRGRTACRGRQD